MLKQCDLHKVSQLVTSCTQNGTTQSKKNTKIIQYVTKISGQVVLEPQSGAIFTRKVK